MTRFPILGAAIESRLDAIDPTLTAFFARELETVLAKNYDTKLQPLKVRMLVPTFNGVDPASEIYTYRSFTPTGMAKIVRDYASDLPRADVFGKEFTAVIRSLGASFGYSMAELRASKKEGRELDIKKANAARRVMEELLDTIGTLGDSQSGMLGLLNQPNTTSFTVPAGASTHTDWARKTPDEMLADMFGISNGIVTQTHEVEIPDTLVLPELQYGDAATRRVSSLADTTVLEYFLAKSPYIKNVEQWNRLKGTGFGGADQILCYRKDPDALFLVVPMEFTQYPPQEENLTFKVPCEMRTGGVCCPYPLSVSIAYGI